MARPSRPTSRATAVGSDGVSVLAELVTTNAELRRIEERVHLLVVEARRAGCTWPSIASATGVTARTARRRWPTPPAGSRTEMLAASADAAGRAAAGYGGLPPQGGIPG